IPFALEQTIREGWATGRTMFETYVEHDPDGAFIAWHEGGRAGMVTTTRYAASAWIGNLIVPPAVRSRGIGRALMERGLRHLRETGASTVRLDGDPPGLTLYRSLGFVDEYESLRFRRDPEHAGFTARAKPLEPGDLAEVLAFDAEHFGDDRGRLLRALFRRSRHAFVARRDGKVVGHVLTEETNLGLRAGPCVATDAEVARRLLETVLAAAGPYTVTLGIPAPNQHGRELLEALGFSPTPSSLRMVLGERQAGGTLERIFTIAGGAIG
ncbi:MAG: GNAT family N-acetyltransferase, partial [Thermoanaerobaculales bacterium]